MNLCIAHGGDLSEPSGGTDRISAFAAGLAEWGHTVTIVAPRPAGTLPSRLNNVNLEIVPISRGGVIDQLPRAILVARRAREIAAEQSARLQIEHSTLGGVVTFFDCSEFVLDMHDFAFESPLYGELPFGSIIKRAIRYIEGRALRAASRVIVVSEQMREFAAAEWNIPQEKFRVVPNGYFPSTVVPYQDIETVTDRVAFLGTLHPKLDIEALCEVARLPEVGEMVVIGDGPRRNDLERLRDARNAKALRLTGQLPDEDAFELVASAAVAVNPQHFSRLQVASSPVKLYYYAALRRPMVVTSGPEAAEHLSEQGAAILVEPGGAFAATVQHLLRDEKTRESMAESARKASAEATWQARVDTVREMYRSLP